jgi:7-cyano-7-deazaguanine synthase
MILGAATGPIGLLLSGGLDSCILLGRLLDEGHRVQPFYVRSGLVWEPQELDAARRFLAAVGRPELADLVILNLPLADLYDGHWSVTGREPPGACSPDSAVYLPGRNALLLVKPALWCRLHGIDRLALGVLGSSPFGDATAEFFEDFESALEHATGGRVRIVRPFAGFGKRQVMDLGRGLPLEMTFSCIAPAAGQHCGQCNKCAERSAAFRLIDVDDPTRYAGEKREGRMTKHK